MTIDDGEDNDFIHNGGSNVTINAGDGNDSIRNYSDKVTIEGSAGNDTLRNRGDNVLFDYADGDSNDVIYGFNESSTLQIGDGSGTYSTVKSGSDILVSVGDDKITLRGAASLDTINIAGKDSTRLTLNNRSNAKQTIDAAIRTVDASTRPSRFVLQATSWRILCWAARAMIR